MSLQISPIRVTVKGQVFGAGTGKDKGLEVFPTTDILLKKLGVKDEERFVIRTKQEKVFDLAIDFETIKNLREYQLDDVRFLAARKCAGCFNEQRTGKTPTALSVMKVKEVTKLLIIAPASTLYTWAKECKTWWFTGLPVYVCDGPTNKRKQLIENWKVGALIISYECLREVTRTSKNEFGEIEEMYQTGDLAYIRKHKDIQGCILDEAHRIKNHKSKQAQALFSLDYIPHRLALTGTPAPGKQHEVFSILHWLYPQVFSGYWRFIDYYFTQYDEWTSAGAHKVIGPFKRGKAEELQQYLNVISTRRLRASVMAWLPEKDRIKVPLPLTTDQERYIQQLREDFEITSTDVDAINILAQLVKIRQICLAPAILGLKGKSPKVEWIKQYLKDYPEKSIIIFSNFTEWLKYLGKELDCNNFIIGETSKVKREQLKNDFQSGKIKLLLINIKAGKEGITLDKADVAIFTDKYPPVGDIQQAEDRFVATSKDRLDSGHTIIDLYMDDSYEVNILKMLSKNASEVDIINNYINYIKEVK